MASNIPEYALTASIALFKDITDEDYAQVCDFLYEKIGVVIGRNKQTMVMSRLAKRLRLYNLDNYGDYFQRTVSGSLPGEEQVMLDLLTTNETYLFREPAHFSFLRNKVLAPWNRQFVFRAWSAACSTGEEAYSLAMETHDKLGESAWEIIASDVSSAVLPVARAAKYSLTRSANIPSEYLREYCKKGVNSEDGSLLVSKALRDRIHFRIVNLVNPLPNDLGLFDVIFLRNTLIYFDEPARRAIIARLVKHLKIGGHFFISHTETIAGFCADLKLVQPSVYQKVTRMITDTGDL